MTDKILSVDNGPHELVLGASFDPKTRVAYHSIRYDFKPASVDTSKEAMVEIGEGHHVTLTVPHVEGSGKTNTVYKGNKRPVAKECILIIDHDTGIFTLERLTNNINVKKTRIDNYSKTQGIGRPITPVDTKAKTSPGKVKPSYSPSAPVKQPSPPSKIVLESSVLGEISDSSSDDYSYLDSDSDADHSTDARSTVSMAAVNLQPVQTQNNVKQNGLSLISADLQLSESDSD